MKVTIGNYTFTNLGDAVSFAMRRYDMTRKKAEVYVRQLEIKQKSSDTQAKKKEQTRFSKEVEKSFSNLDKEVKQEQRRNEMLVGKSIPNYGLAKGKGQRTWWLAGNINPANCIAAYQAIRAPSQRESYLNLAKHNLYRISEVVKPAWNAKEGWVFTGTEYLNTGILVKSDSQVQSAIVRYSGVSGSGSLFGAYYDTSNYFMAKPNPLLGIITMANGDDANASGLASSSGVVCVAGASGYFNGADTSISLTTWTHALTELMAIGALTTSGSYILTGNIQAFAYYDITLTLDQVKALTLEMERL